MNHAKEELAVMKVDWVYPSKVNKAKLVALLTRLKKGGKYVAGKMCPFYLLDENLFK